MSQGDAASYAEPARSANAGRAGQRLTSEVLSILGVGAVLAALMLACYAGLRADLRALHGELIDHRAETHAQFEALRGEMQALTEEIKADTVIRTGASPSLSVSRAGVGPRPAMTTPAAPLSWT